MSAGRDAWRCALILAVVLGGPLVATADQRDPRLPALFADLQRAPSAATGDALEMRIWSIWMTSVDPQVNELLERGGQAMAEGRLDDAVARFSDVIERDPEFAEGWNKRATAHYLRRDFTASMQDIRQTLTLEPRHFGAISGMGLIFMQRGDLRGALEAFEHVLSIHPQAQGARYYQEVLRRELRVGNA